MGCYHGIFLLNPSLLNEGWGSILKRVTHSYIFSRERPLNKQLRLRQGMIIPIILWINNLYRNPPIKLLKCRWPQRRVCPFFVPGEEIPLWSLDVLQNVKVWGWGICKVYKKGSILNIHDSWTNSWFKKSEALNQTCEIRGVVAVSCIQIMFKSLNHFKSMRMHMSKPSEHMQSHFSGGIFSHAAKVPILHRIFTHST